MRLIQINKKEFFMFCKESPLDNFFQTKEYAEIKRKDGYHTYFVGLEDSGKLRAAALLLSHEFSFARKRVFTCPRGFILDYRDFDLVNLFTKEIIEYIKRKNGIFLRINPCLMLKERNENGEIVPFGMNNTKCINNLLKAGFNEINEEEYKEPKYVYQINLKGKNNDELYNSIDDKIRYNLDRNEKIGISTKKLDKDQVDRFIDILKNSPNGINFFASNARNYKNLVSILSNYNMVDIINAELDIDKYLEVTLQSLKNASNNKELADKIQSQLSAIKDLQYKYGHKVILGTLLSVYYNEKYLTLCIASMDKFKNYDPNSTLIYESMKYAKKRGATQYILYGLQHNLEDPDNLVNYYKNFNGKVIEFIGEFDYIINNFYYQKYLRKQDKKNR